MSVATISNNLRRFDAYPKTLEDFRIKTFGGAVVTLLSSILMFALFVSEFKYYLTTEVHQELFVDTSRGQKIKINIDMTFHKIPCAFLSVDAMDVSGEQQIDVDTSLYKFRIDEYGNEVDDTGEKEELAKKSTDKPLAGENTKPTLSPTRCESCYGAETASTQCCNTCEAVRDAYRKRGWAIKNVNSIAQCEREGWDNKMITQKNEGCRFYGHLLVNKVAGNFHFAPGKSYQQHHVHVHDLQVLKGQQYNSSHTIKHLSFGHDYPGIVNPLDDATIISDTENIMYQYFVKVVPTTYVKLSGNVLYTNQYSVTKHFKPVLGGTGEQGLPGVFVLYELSPMMVKYTEKQRSFMHFLTGVCAIIGGIFTVAGLIDSFIYHSSNALKKKIELGKAS